MGTSFSKSNFIFLESNNLVKFLPNQNYTDNKLLGYGNLQLNGLDYYVVDGSAASILKVSLHHALGAVSIKIDSYLIESLLLNINFGSRPLQILAMSTVKNL